MNHRGLVRQVLRCTGLSLCFFAQAAFADFPARWLQSQPLAEVPAPVREMLIEALGDTSAPIVDGSSCIEHLRRASDVRPSVIESVCAYVEFELATVRDGLVANPDALQRARAQLLELSVARDVGRWREFVAIQSGWLARLAAHPEPSDSRGDVHPALRPWRMIAALERGDPKAAGAQHVLLGAPGCPSSCAHAALVAVAQGKLALHDDRRDKALSLAERAAGLLDSAARREPQLAVLLAPEVAVLLDDLEQDAQRDQVLSQAETLAEQVLPTGHAARRHLGVTRLALTADEGRTEAAQTLYERLRATHGRTLTSYPLTAKQLRRWQASGE